MPNRDLPNVRRNNPVLMVEIGQPIDHPVEEGIGPRHHLVSTAAVALQPAADIVGALGERIVGLEGEASRKTLLQRRLEGIVPAYTVVLIAGHRAVEGSKQAAKVGGAERHARRIYGRIKLPGTSLVDGSRPDVGD